MGRTFTQSNRPIAVKVEGLDPDALLLVGFTGEEAISTLFHYQLEVLVENPPQVSFEKILGKSVTVELELHAGRRARSTVRYFNGICNRVTQGESDKLFTRFRLDVVPSAWLLTKIARSRIFQNKPVLDIVEKMFNDMGVGNRLTWERYESPEPRDYCVQYRETDFNFAARLMAEEGFYFQFKHELSGAGNGMHTLLATNASSSRILSANVVYRQTGGDSDGNNVRSWAKVQELRSGQVTLRDHTFEKPDSDLQAKGQIQPEVKVGKVSHKLNGANSKLELYDYPGQYAKRLNGINRGGVEQLEQTGKIIPEGERTARLRMEQEATAAVVIQGESDCRLFNAGEEFYMNVGKGGAEELAQAEGQYLLTSVRHEFRLPAPYASGKNDGFFYRNSFTCVPSAMPFRPRRSVPKPVIAGTHTAVVVGPKDGEVFTDKYGRVKVQFFWDREGKKDLDSSCWIRVAQVWAGQRWGAHFWPRVGQEVVVAFFEGDPDQPIIVGSVYNAQNMPPYEMPNGQTRSGIKTHSTPQDKNSYEHYNEIRFEDKKGAEELYVQAERTMNVLVKGDENRVVGGDSDTKVHGKKGMSTYISKGDHYLGVEEGGSNIGANKKIGIFSIEDRVVLSSGEEPTQGNKPTKLIQVTPNQIALGFQGNGLIINKDGLFLFFGNAYIRLLSTGAVVINGTSVDMNPAAAPPADHTVEFTPGAVVKTLATIFGEQLHAGIAKARANGQLPAGANVSPSVAAVP